MNERTAAFTQLLSGRGTDKATGWYIFIALAMYLGGMVVAMLTYDGGFSFQHVYVSYLGAPDHNPAGWWIYNTGELISGAMLVPAFLFMYRKIRGTIKILAGIGCIFGIVGSLGFASLGIFFQGADPEGHRWATILAFGGFGLAALLLLPVLVTLVARGQRTKAWHLFITYGQLFTFIILAVAFDHVLGDKGTEWLYTFAAIGWLIGGLSMAVGIKPPAQPSS